MNTLELIIVIALFAVCMSGILIVVFLTQDTFIKNNIAFSMFLEGAHDQVDLEENIFMAFSGATSSVVINRTPCIQDVAFPYIHHTYQVMTLNRLFFDLDRDSTLGRDCLGYPNKPTELIKKETLELSDITLTGVDIQSGTVVVSGYAEATSSPDAFIVSLEPFEVLDELDSGDGINSLDAANGFAYAAAKQTTGQFQVFKIESDVLELVATSSLPTVSGSWPEGLSIFYQDEKAYIGTHRTAGREFHIFDVSDPYHPIWLGSREINHNINDITVKGNIAYLATSGNIRDVIVLNVADPTNITHITAIDITGNEDGRRIFISGSMLYLGRFKSTVQSTKDVYGIRLDESDSTLFETAFSYRLTADVADILSVGSSVLVGSRRDGGELSIISATDSSEYFQVSVPSITAFDLEHDDLVAVSEDGEVSLFEMR